MSPKTEKLVVVPVDGSRDSLKAVDYLRLLYPPQHPLRVHLLNVILPLPKLLREESRKDRDMAHRLKETEARNKAVAERHAAEARQHVLDKGFAADRIVATAYSGRIGAAQDICHYAEDKRADAILLSTRGKSRLEAFFMGATAHKVVEASRVNPVWLVKGSVKRGGVLVCLDGSANAMRAADHAAFMLSGTPHSVVLLHATRTLRRFASTEVLETSAELTRFWRDVAGREIEPKMVQARQMFIDAGIPPDQIRVQVAEGKRFAVEEILDAARRLNCGTIVLGRRGLSNVSDYIMGRVARKVLEASKDTALWIVG